MAGFSIGGCVALEVAARAPDRVGRLALLSTSSGGLLPPVRRQLRDSISGIQGGGFDAYLADAFPRYVAPERIDDRALWGIFAAMGRVSARP